ncbi:MAG: dihydropteroate synthase [Candidatus Omnitrophica bacterium]|nr:dihydropteroate synthase [Candidatus Omnitrophota bacterium]
MSHRIKRSTAVNIEVLCEKRTMVMGILNVTPDSFSDGGKYLDVSKAVEHARSMVEAGADIIDIGGESSRPGALPVSAAEEEDRVLPVIRALKADVDVPVSIDTRKSRVASAALSEGASIVNDITAMTGDPDMADLVARSSARVVLMHMKGTPEHMQDDPVYGDVVSDVRACLKEAMDRAVERGISPDRIILDPGIGFGKTVGHNLALLRHLDSIRELGRPVLVGTSRKSFIGKLTGKPEDRRSYGTAASIAVAVMNGADIVRVHDVAETLDVVRVVDAVRRG